MENKISGVTSGRILEVVLDMNERMATKDDLERLRGNLEWKIEDAKSELMAEITPLSKAIDKDAKTVVAHEKRITVLERKVGVVTK